MTLKCCYAAVFQCVDVAAVVAGVLQVYAAAHIDCGMHDGRCMVWTVGELPKALRLDNGQMPPLMKMCTVLLLLLVETLEFFPQPATITYLATAMYELALCNKGCCS